jgi:hypothetical protein
MGGRVVEGTGLEILLGPCRFVLPDINSSRIIRQPDMLQVPLRTRVILNTTLLVADEVGEGSAKAIKTLSVTNLDTETSKHAAQLLISKESLDASPELAMRLLGAAFPEALNRSKDGYLIGKLQAEEVVETSSPDPNPSPSIMFGVAKQPVARDLGRDRCPSAGRDRRAGEALAASRAAPGEGDVMGRRVEGEQALPRRRDHAERRRTLDVSCRHFRRNTGRIAPLAPCGEGRKLQRQGCAVMMTLAEVLAKAEQSWREIVAEHRLELERLCIENSATERELDMVLAEHDRLEQEWIAEKRDDLRTELIAMSRIRLH